MIDQKFTSAYVKLIGGLRDMGDWGEETGLLDVEKVRLTVAARREKAKELTDAGMSRRQAADILGVAHQTINNDLNGKKIAEDGKKVATPDPDDPENDDAAADAEHDEGLRIIAARGFLNRAIEAKKICTIDKLQPPDITEAMIEAAYDAAAAWGEAAHNLREMISNG